MSKIIAVDFDGTLCEECWPGIGPAKKEVIEYVKRQKADGARLILWTCRCGKELEAAVAWSREQGIEYDAVNKNLPCVVKAFGGSDCRKVVADEYLDDRALLPGSLGSGQKGNRRLTSAYAARNGTRNREKESEQ